jgi:DNA transposition AAA+ family ATPase
MKRELTDEAVKEAREQVREWMRTRPDITSADIAQYCPTLADSTVRGWIAGNFPGGRQVVDTIVAAVERAKAGDILAPGGSDSITLTVDAQKPVRKLSRAGRFYRTQTATRIGEVLEYCAENAAIGIVTADFGCGKTEAVREWRRQRGAAIECAVLEFNSFNGCDKVEFVREMCRMFDLPVVEGSQSGGRMFRTLCQHLNSNPCLLVFDQVEAVRPRVCQVIREIHDQTRASGVGVVILAAPILMARLASRKMADLGALSSRVGIWAPLGGITKPEMAAIVKAEGITEVDEAAFDLWFKACGGSMRRLMRSIDLLKAKHQGKQIGEKTIVGVGGMLWGMNVERAA